MRVDGPACCCGARRRALRGIVAFTLLLAPLSTRQLHRIVVDATESAGFNKRVGPHTLRHSFATHLLEDGVDIRIIQALFGHANLETTAFYTTVATRTVRAVISPPDLTDQSCR